jgi:branched-subunit amino acid transport protein
MGLAAAEAGTLDLLALLVIGSSILILLIRVVIVIVGRKAQIFSQWRRHIDFVLLLYLFDSIVGERAREEEPKS